ncbi:hypothetical protein D3C87_1334390 [compost metagenome]
MLLEFRVRLVNVLFVGSFTFSILFPDAFKFVKAWLFETSKEVKLFLETSNCIRDLKSSIPVKSVMPFSESSFIYKILEILSVFTFPFFPSLSIFREIRTSSNFESGIRV